MIGYIPSVLDPFASVDRITEELKPVDSLSSPRKADIEYVREGFGWPTLRILSSAEIVSGALEIVMVRDTGFAPCMEAVAPAKAVSVTVPARLTNAFSPLTETEKSPSPLPKIEDTSAEDKTFPYSRRSSTRPSNPAGAPILNGLPPDAAGPIEPEPLGMPSA